MKCKKRLQTVFLTGLALLFLQINTADTQEIRVARLKKQNLQPEKLTKGWNVEGSIPETGRVFSVRDRQYVLLDLNDDGKIQAGGNDGLTVPEYPFVVYLEEKLLLPIGQCRIKIRETRIQMITENLEIKKSLVRDASVLTRLRIRSGVSPVLLSGEASKHCRQHLDYLIKNDIRQGMKMHREKKGNPGYTKTGARAGGNSILHPEIRRYRKALFNWYKTAWHGAAMILPNVEKVGIGLKDKIAILYPYKKSDDREEPFQHPPDDARDVPATFTSRGEIPNPVPGTTNAIGCRMPVFLRLTETLRKKKVEKARLIGPDGNEVKGSVSSPSNPANKRLPSNAGLALFVPNNKLRRDSTYRVVFRLQGVDKAFKWSFQTR